jgi:hypothetical protein
MNPLRPRRKRVSRKRSLNLPELEQCKNTRPEQPSLIGIEARLSARHRSLHRVVLLGASTCVEPDRCPALSTRATSSND